MTTYQLNKCNCPEGGIAELLLRTIRQDARSSLGVFLSCMAALSSRY
jgi:hypothetical protein